MIFFCFLGVGICLVVPGLIRWNQAKKDPQKKTRARVMTGFGAAFIYLSFMTGSVNLAIENTAVIAMLAVGAGVFIYILKGYRNNKVIGKILITGGLLTALIIFVVNIILLISQ